MSSVLKNKLNNTKNLMIERGCEFDPCFFPIHCTVSEIDEILLGLDLLKMARLEIENGKKLEVMYFKSEEKANGKII